MGNYVSCTLAAPLMKNSKAVRVIFPGGEVRQFRETVKAAELMLELPNFFLANSGALHIGRRFSALSADEELEFGNVYVMFPMRRVNSVITAADLAMFFMAANSAAKRISGGKVRILPDSGVSNNTRELSTAVDFDQANSRGDHDQSGQRDVKGSTSSLDGVHEGFELVLPEFKYRLAACRSRKPMLETIKEEPIYLR
ncbi:hypothetical protein L484_025872 [Morus notabilis]|uniref:DUF4228 domain-containing protein n=1 Tax=Morus notabilis TaxID=981085 RepID=W9R2I9_9ROSA|nr:uncharacterized protein LOC21408554 [Morus notabilis]EXB65606.1 hypothetical protein L484_025872 [Morus notabilis]